MNVMPKPATILQLDAVTFQDFEIPSVIAFGGSQQLAVHKMPGGLRKIDSMGRDDAPLEWEGIFTGRDALSRAQFLDGYRVGGAVHLLTWNTFRYNVIVREFRAKYERAQHVPYRIVCEVLQDLTKPNAILQTGRDLDSSITDPIGEVETLIADLKDSISMAVTSAMKTVKTAFAKAQALFTSSMQGIASVVNLETSVIASLQNYFDESQAATSGCITLINNGVNQLSALVSGDSSAVAGVTGTSLGAQVANMLAWWAVDSVNLVVLNQIKARIINISRNLGYINGFPNAQETTVTGGTLMDLALKYYNDATQWQTIATANGLSDPVITGQMTLAIPPASTTPATIGGGVDMNHWIGDDVGFDSVAAGSKAQQRILRRLLTNPGEYIWHSDYGAGVLKHVGDTQYTLAALEALIVSQVLLEQGVAQTPSPTVTFKTYGDEVTASIQYNEENTDSRQFLTFTVSA